MLRKPSALKTINHIVNYLTDVEFHINNSIKDLFVPVSQSGILGVSTHGKHRVKTLLATESGFMEFIVPHVISSFREVTVRFIPTTNGTIDYTFNLSYGSVNMDEDSKQKTKTESGVSVTDDRITEIDVTSVFTDQNKGDQVGCEFKVDALTTTTEINLLGLYIKYI